MALTGQMPHGTPVLALRAVDGASAIAALHGAHVMSWMPAGGHGEQLYLSPRSGFADGQAIRGGVPVVFPRFSDRGPLPRHGFVRNRPWRVVRRSLDADGAATAVPGLGDDERTRATWPHAFALELRLRLSGLELETGLHCTNTGPVPWPFADPSLPAKRRAFTLSAEMFLMRHTCHWYCRSRAVASARPWVRHKTRYAQLFDAVTPDTTRDYKALLGR